MGMRVTQFSRIAVEKHIGKRTTAQVSCVTGRKKLQLRRAVLLVGKNDSSGISTLLNDQELCYSCDAILLDFSIGCCLEKYEATALESCVTRVTQFSRIAVLG